MPRARGHDHRVRPSAENPFLREPVYASGVADPEVDGLTLREVRQILPGPRGGALTGADVVCFCPPLDNPSQITALTASQLLREFITRIADAR